MVTAIKDITIDVDSYPSGPAPIYPVHGATLKELLKGTKLNVFVGSRPNLDLVFAFSKALLAYFAPALRQDLRNRFGNNVVILHDTDKKVASSVFRWMIAGGKDISYLGMAADTNPNDSLLKRFRIITEFGIGCPAADVQATSARMCKSKICIHCKLYGSVKALVFNGQISMAMLEWMFNSSTSKHVQSTALDLAQSVVNAKLKGAMINIIPDAKHHLLFKAKVNAALVSKKGWIYKKQHIERAPLTQHQVRFVYDFTEKDSAIRAMVVRDLLYLMDHGYAPKAMAYHIYGLEEKDFHEDMESAIAKQVVHLQRKMARRRQYG
ncbi:hypothetical protein MMC13_003597 [Lambiella insularis]|nr:hypothetical protein [Lambiella insularis]